MESAARYAAGGGLMVLAPSARMPRATASCSPVRSVDDIELEVHLPCLAGPERAPWQHICECGRTQGWSQLKTHKILNLHGGRICSEHSLTGGSEELTLP